MIIFIGIADDDEGLPSIDDNIVNIQRGVVSSASGDDTYILSSAVVDSNARITLSDNQGTNKIQLFEGLGIASSIVATDTVLLALSNGAEITLLGASSFTFETGGNPLAGTFGVTNNYTSFVSNVLGSSVPESNMPNNGSAITINADGTITVGATDNFPNDGAVSTDSDLLVVQRGVVSSASGDDTYVLSSSTVDPNARITISDNQGDNRIQLFEGLDIASSIVATDTALLTLSNGAEITLLGASLFSYETGGNPLAGEIGAINSYSDFVSNILGSSVPGTGSAPNNGGSVTIGTNESSNNIDDQDGGIELIQGNSLVDIVV